MSLVGFCRGEGGKQATFGLACAEAASGMVKLGLYSEGLASQLDDAQNADWNGLTQREVDDIKLAIRDVVSGGTNDI